jgi:hypothetical protein
MPKRLSPINKIIRNGRAFDDVYIEPSIKYDFEKHNLIRETFSPNFNQPIKKQVQRISKDFMIQETFEKYSKRPILDLNAYNILRNNTKRKDGISDIPFDHFESVKADPGYGLPML